MRHLTLIASTCVALLSGCASAPPPLTVAQLQQQVADTERAFAKTMADRDHAGFASFLAADTVFFSGPKPLHGKDPVAAWWKRYYDKPAAPFSWKPEQVEVLDSGTLALTTGPVYDAAGNQFASFTSIWRLEAPGVWRIIFDKGNDVCDCTAPVAGGAATAPATSLFDRLGGLPAITEVVDRSVDRHVADPRTRRSFEGINLKALKASIVSQMCNATGGPCKYEGESMIKAHHGLAITPLEFDTAIGHIRVSMNELHVGAREQQEFLQIVLPMKSDVVGR